MDQKKLKKDAVDEGGHRGKSDSESPKKHPAEGSRGPTTNATTTPTQTGEPHVGPRTEHHSGQLANSGHTGTTPMMKQDAGKRDIREPETPPREQEIREPNPDEQEAASQSRKESRREAAIEENPPQDEGNGKEAA